MGRPKKHDPPYSFNEWLNVALRDKRLEDRMKIFREWIRWNIKATHRRDPLDHEVDDLITTFQNRKFYFAGQDYNWIDGIRMDFLPIYHKENHQKRAKKMAVASWSKKARKKRKKNKKSS